MTTTTTTTTLHLWWISPDEQASMCCGTHPAEADRDALCAQAAVELLRQCATQEERQAVVSGTFRCESDATCHLCGVQS